MMLRQLKSAILIFAVLTLLTGVVYPLFVTGIAQVFFKHQAEGSLISRDGKLIGSALIGQQFDDPKYFWGRPSAASFNGASSFGSNLGPSNQDLLKSVEQRINAFKAADPGNSAPVPVDLVTASASGLDPHISLAGAYYQAGRIARVRGLPLETVDAVIQRHKSGRFLGIMGEPVVNVLEANLELENYGTPKSR
jgi:potassium-transporting ATPase KdpC subunit